MLLKVVFFLNNFNGVLYFVLLLFIELFQICLVMGKNSGKGTLSKVFFDVPRVWWRVSQAGGWSSK